MSTFLVFFLQILQQVMYLGDNLTKNLFLKVVDFMK